MSLAHTLQVLACIDSAFASGQRVAELFAPFAAQAQVQVTPVRSDQGQTDFIRIAIRGHHGKHAGGPAPTLGVVGRLGGVGARPERIGMVSDADGAVAVLAAALKLAHMAAQGDALSGDVLLCTHICPNAPIRRRDPVDFMASPVDMATRNAQEVAPEMDALLSVDTTKGNRIVNHKGFAISPTVKEGYILRVSEDLLRIMEATSGRPAVTFPITTQDITPYDNGVYHLNSIMQPATATRAPTVGVAITAATLVAGSATGASDEVDIAAAVRFIVEVAKEFTSGSCCFFDAAEYERLLQLYGSLAHLQGGAIAGL
jgi:Protein of unknown function (DUF1177)